MEILKPPRLEPGSTVAAISLSSGAAERFPRVYAAAKRELERSLGVRVIETPHALKSSAWLYRHPEARAADLHWALEHPEVRAVVSTIGGYESVRTLPFVDLGLIRRHPKILLGFSDTTTAHTAFARAGVVSFYGPSLLAGFADLPHYPYTEAWARRVLQAPWRGPFAPAERWTDDLSRWEAADDEAERQRPRAWRGAGGWRWLQGEARAEGRLIGGCADVLEMLKGTRWWPGARLWEGAVLLLETSEEVPPPSQVEYWLRNYASQGILEGLAGLVLARARGYTPEMRAQLHDGVRKVLAEVGRAEMPVLAEVDCGHTTPMLTLPLGCRVALEPAADAFELLEPGVL